MTMRSSNVADADRGKLHIDTIDGKVQYSLA
jgi:hypothetical protein